jgi:osmotically-inducible protein OsmY
MRQSICYRKVGVVTALLAAGLASGCVLVVGADGASRGTDVEWSTWDRGGRTEPAAVDGGLAREVQSRIRTDSSLAGEDITVSSSGSVVTLHGRVGDLVLLEHAMQVAATVPGVTRVVSRLTVEMETS